MHQISSEIVIHKPAGDVWQALIKFEEYPHWNPFIKYIKGIPVVGGKIEAKLQPKGSGGMIYRPTILDFDENKKLRWLGHTYFKGLFDGEHTFELYKIDQNSTRFVQTEKFTGILTSIFKKFIDQNTMQSFEEMNQALKLLVERA